MTGFVFNKHAQKQGWEESFVGACTIMLKSFMKMDGFYIGNFSL